MHAITQNWVDSHVVLSAELDLWGLCEEVIIPPVFTVGKTGIELLSSEQKFSV
jgi:hypothetical protein